MIDQKSISLRAWAELTLLGLIWGASFLAIRVALDELPVLTTVLHRTFWAMLVLWAVVLARRLPIPRSPRVWGAFLVMGLLNNAIPFGLMAWGQLYIESGLAAILNAATAIFGVTLAAIVFADERLTPARLLGVGLGFFGVVTTIGLGNLAQLDLRSGAQLAVLGGAFSYACASVWARLNLGGLPPLVAAAGMLTGSTLLIVPATLLVDGVPSLALAPATWAAIGYYGLVATAGAYLLYYRILAMAGSGNLMLVTLLIPPVAIALGAAVRAEALPPRAFTGFALLALGLLILNIASRHRRD
ncbi:EamA-like transporter family protein [Cribrihabitans marinus]|uniref:EamA-like transporter family protein n=1 Tax=Cribrihabitans marinus TaxID=1227549 RepID=A0A1H6W004_9RHOB|nr:DMT family transporter [Cribrihabitans marinus]GGH25509.1 multidrug transporter [Cribrihabitans marinus]SEJ05615.1 EamA-like transporter family protein [Cribrihabitans marinus]